MWHGDVKARQSLGSCWGAQISMTHRRWGTQIHFLREETVSGVQMYLYVMHNRCCGCWWYFLLLQQWLLWHCISVCSGTMVIYRPKITAGLWVESNCLSCLSPILSWVWHWRKRRKRTMPYQSCCKSSIHPGSFQQGLTRERCLTGEYHPIIPKLYSASWMGWPIYMEATAKDVFATMQSWVLCLEAMASPCHLDRRDQLT